MPYITTLDEVASALAVIPADERDTWLRMGMAIKSEFGDAGFDVWDDWSSRAGSYKQADAKSVWKSIKAGGGVTIGSLIDEARRCGYQFPEDDLSDEERARRQREAQQRREQARKKAEKVEALRRAGHETIADLSQHVVRELLYTSGLSGYLEAKQVQPNGALFVRQRFVVWCSGDPDAGEPVQADVITGRDAIARFFKEVDKDRVSFRYFKAGTLVLPMRDAGGRVWNLQAIFANGSKKFLKHGRKQGTFFLISETAQVGALRRVLLAEGFATGASLHEATQLPVAVAWDAGNLLPVAQALGGESGDIEPVFCGDDDPNTEGNPGRTKAEKAAKATGSVAVFPDFPEGVSGTDWNDLAVAAGLEAVRRQVMGRLSKPASTPPDRSAQGALDEIDPAHEEGLIRNQDGKPASNLANVLFVLQNDTRWAGVLGYCEFSYRIIKRKPPPFPQGAVGEWTDSDTARLRIWLTQQYRFTCKSNDTDDAVLVAAQAQSFHPVRDYLGALEWDGEVRVPYWLHLYLGAEGTEYEMAVSKMWLIGAVARVLDPPIKVDNVLILEGNQGAGKSTALSVLGGDWFDDTHFALGEKDGYQQMQGVWLCELAELDSFNKAESTRAKQFFSSVSDRYRPSYGRRAINFPRQCVFAGSTNQDNYLKDYTGNRRYWPVRCGQIDLQRLRQDRDQLWAEAVHLYRKGVPWWPDGSVAHLFHDEQEKRFQADAWQDLVEDWLTDPDQRTEKRFTVAQILRGALKLEPHQMKPPEQTRIGLIMTRLGWIKRRVTIEEYGKSRRAWIYERPEEAETG